MFFYLATSWWWGMRVSRDLMSEWFSDRNKRKGDLPWVWYERKEHGCVWDLVVVMTMGSLCVRSLCLIHSLCLRANNPMAISSLLPLSVSSPFFPLCIMWRYNVWFEKRRRMSVEPIDSQSRTQSNPITTGSQHAGRCQSGICKMRWAAICFANLQHCVCSILHLARS